MPQRGGRSLFEVGRHARVGGDGLFGQPINLNNGTLIITGNLVTNGTVIGTAKFAVNGTNPVLLANGTVVASGGASDFILTQGALNSAGASIGANAPIAVVLTNSQAAISGTSGTGKVSLVNVNNAIGGTLKVNTGTVLNSGGMVTKYFNLVETAALSLGSHGLNVLADAGTLFGGPNTLNGGKGSTVALTQGGNQFASVQLQQVADSTIDGANGVTIGASTVHGNLLVSMTGSGGITTSGAIVADNHTGTAPTNTAMVTLDDEDSGISIGADVTAGTLNLTGNGSIVQTAGVLSLVGDLNVADKQAGNATLTGNTAAGSSGTLTLGNSSVNGDLVLATNALLQPASDQSQGTKLIVGGTLDLANVNTSTFNGTVVVGDDIQGTHPITGGTIAVGGLNHPQLAQGTIAPTFNNLTGTTFTPTQAMLDAASSGVGSGGTIAIQLFGPVADRSIGASGGSGRVLLNQGGNRIGGTLTVTTGPSLGSISLTTGDVNLGQSGALSTGSKLEILAHKGTAFGGSNTLNTGLGSFVNLVNASNSFGSGDAVFLSDVSNTTLDGSSGITIGGSLDGSLFTNTVHGNLTVGTGGEIDVASAIQAHSSGTTDTAIVSLASGSGAVSQDGTNGSIAAATLTGSAGTSASLGAGNTIGTLAGFATRNGSFLFNDTTGVAVTGTVAATHGDASIAAAGNIVLGAPVSAATGAVTLNATAGSITDPTNANGARTDVTAASVTLSATAGIGIPSGTSTAGTPLTLAAPMIAAVTDAGGINLVNNTGTAAAVSTIGVTSGPGDILFIQRGGGNLSIADATDANGNIGVDVVGADLTVTNASTQNGGNITLGLGSPNNLTLNGTVSASGSLLGRADINVNLDAATLSSGGRTTLIVDDAFPSRGIGPGALTVTGATTITTETGDNLALFLARRSQVVFGAGGTLTLNGQPFFDDPDAKFAKDQTVSFVHFGVYYSPTIAPDAGEAFTVFFKESLQTPPPKNFEDETPLPMLSNRSYPIAFGMLYQAGGAPTTVASLAAISPAAGGPETVRTADTDGILGYARISSFDVAPDIFSAINRPLYMDIQNPRTEEQLGYELRPTLQARVDAPSAEALAAIEPAGPGAFSCARLPETLALLDNPELAQHLRDLCAKQGQQNLPEVPVRPVRYFRAVR